MAPQHTVRYYFYFYTRSTDSADVSQAHDPCLQATSSFLSLPACFMLTSSGELRSHPHSATPSHATLTHGSQFSPSRAYQQHLSHGLADNGMRHTPTSSTLRHIWNREFTHFTSTWVSHWHDSRPARRTPSLRPTFSVASVSTCQTHLQADDYAGKKRSSDHLSSEDKENALDVTNKRVRSARPEASTCRRQQRTSCMNHTSSLPTEARCRRPDHLPKEQ